MGVGRVFTIVYVTHIIIDVVHISTGTSSNFNQERDIIAEVQYHVGQRKLRPRVGVILHII